MLKNEVNDLQLKQMALLESITNCTKELDFLEMEKRLKDNIIKELELANQEARNSIHSAKDSRGQEISILNQKLADSDKILTTLQSQLEESLLKISKQNTEIRDLTEKLEDYKFLNENKPDTLKTSLRGSQKYSFP
jgi:hypothetical protein